MTHPVFSTLGKIERGRETREQINPLQHICEQSNNTDIRHEMKNTYTIKLVDTK